MNIDVICLNPVDSDAIGPSVLVSKCCRVLLLQWMWLLARENWKLMCRLTIWRSDVFAARYR